MHLHGRSWQGKEACEEERERECAKMECFSKKCAAKLPWRALSLSRVGICARRSGRARSAEVGLVIWRLWRWWWRCLERGQAEDTPAGGASSRAAPVMWLRTTAPSSSNSSSSRSPCGQHTSQAAYPLSPVPTPQKSYRKWRDWGSIFCLLFFHKKKIRK